MNSNIIRSNFAQKQGRTKERQQSASSKRQELQQQFLAGNPNQVNLNAMSFQQMMSFLKAGL